MNADNGHERQGPFTSTRVKRSDVVIIGSGLAGLTSAACLAASGREVTVLEQYGVIGGTTHIFRRKSKWEWQVGVHHLANCGFDGDMPTILRALGIGSDHIRFRRMDDNAFERIVFPDLTFDTPNDWGLYERRLVDAFPEERRKIHRLLTAMRHIGNAIDRGPALASAPGLARAGFGMGMYAPLALLPLQKVLDLYGISTKLQSLITVSPCGSLNSPPSRLPFAFFAAYYRLFIEGGSWYPEGGGQMLAASLLRVIEHYGGTALTGEFVDEILVDNQTAKGVRTRSGTTYLAPVVISTADIKKTYANLLPPAAVKKSTAKRISGFKMSHAFFNAFLGVDVDLTEHHPNRDHFSMPSWRTIDDLNAETRAREGEEVSRWLDRVTPIIPAYAHCSNLKDPDNPRYAPPGSSSLEVMFPLEVDYKLWGQASVETRNHDYASGDIYTMAKERITDAMIDRATTVFPEIEGHVVHREAATPLTQDRYTQSSEGAAYGIELNTHQIGVLRPGPKTEIKGLFLAGASCRPGPTTEGVLLSGIHTTGAILGRNLHKEFKQGRYLVPAGSLPVQSAGSWDPLEFSRRRRAVQRTGTPDGGVTVPTTAGRAETSTTTGTVEGHGHAG
ncbi:phytoene desaturase family protein [Rhodococcus qingshengii]|uniref:phytoene desaturase family protein n=1 Tax=Rhodococcus qingshengii TaxID=334542 RepID=UPI00237D108C|nr:NAD(P)/FAD-dependent oxidoreductase [Rhodococcus qingshengii]WCT06001.1 NAD(P)/FAD-dependent oxidoreductase [Rhodococcus qingshengii]